MFRSAGARDGLVIAAVVIVSLVWYTPHLGFYSDDWAFLGAYANAPDQTVRGLYAASHSPQHAMRPVQLWLCAALYRAFGMNATGGHTVNAVLVVVNPLLVYAIARQIRVSRIVALAVALIYGTLPNYASDRLWYVAFAITLSMTAGLVSLYAELRVVAARVPAAIAWKTTAALALVASVLAYEVVLPLLVVGAPALIAWRLWERRAAVTRRRVIAVLAMLAVNVALVAGLAAFKVRTTVRLHAEQGLTAQVTAIARDALRTDLPRGAYGLNGFNALRVHFSEQGVRLPANALRLARRAPAEALVVTLLAAFGTFAYLRLALRKQPWPPMTTWALLAGAGVVVFALGYAIFITNYNVQFTTTGIANRSAIAAALGVAMCLVGGVGVVLTAVRQPGVRAAIFAAAIAIITGSGVLIINVVAGHWMAAYAEERSVLAKIRTTFPALPPGSTVLLEGVCPYIGPAIVFEADWDLSGALQVYYRDRTLAANVVTPRMTAEADGIGVRIYGQATHYPYSPSLLAFDAGTGAVRPLTDAATAGAWLSRAIATTTCPAGQEGLGVELF